MSVTIWTSEYQMPLFCLSGDGSMLTAASTQDGKVWFKRSTDGGLTWSAPVDVGPVSVPALWLWQDPKGAIYVGSGYGTERASYDMGRTWGNMH